MKKLLLTLEIVSFITIGFTTGFFNIGIIPTCIIYASAVVLGVASYLEGYKEKK